MHTATALPPAGLRILHLCSDYANQQVYCHLVRALDGLELHQDVYVPVRTQQECGKNIAAEATRVRYHFSHVLKPRHRLLFRTKVGTVFNDLMSKVDVRQIDVAHAHFLFSDGAVALRLNERFDLPFVVSVRNTDLNDFMRLRPDLRYIAWRVVRAARTVLFLSPAYQETFLRIVPTSLREEIRSKAVVVPNGIDDRWLTQAEPSLNDDGHLRVLYCGDFSRNKNVPGLIDALNRLAKERPVSLSLVGGGGDGDGEVRRIVAESAAGFTRLLGRIDDHAILKETYAAHHVFAMPSFRETFGMAYLEALSQGVPVLCSRGQGIDGYFLKGGVVETADPRQPGDIAVKIALLAGRRARVREECIAAVKSFRWSEIGKKLRNLYRSALHEAVCMSEHT